MNEMRKDKRSDPTTRKDELSILRKFCKIDFIDNVIKRS